MLSEGGTFVMADKLNSEPFKNYFLNEFCRYKDLQHFSVDDLSPLDSFSGVVYSSPEVIMNES